MVKNRRFAECIEYLEGGLRSLAPTPYHEILGRDFLGETEDLAAWIADFWTKTEAAGLGLQALYLEMNGFTINPKLWFCDIFGYKTAGDTSDLDWLSDWDAEHTERFALSGMEPVQKAYDENFMGRDKALGVELAEDIARHLVVAQFMRLVADAHASAKLRAPTLEGIPVLATAHDWDTVSLTK